ncbi:integral membrane protein [Rutstroemia sp. NJR-2017a BVV2]|nr:integral membrane protein [Rutstroemia sp. NJR-2017a BVV2]
MVEPYAIKKIMRLPPPEVIASWPAPNYINPEKHGNAVIIVDAVFFPLALLILLIRIYTRIRISKSFGLDDWLIVAAMFPTTGFAVAALLSETTLQWDRHIWDVPYNRITSGLQFVMITQIIFTLSQTLTKCSMLALIYRIMSNGKRFKRATIAATALITGQGLIFIIVLIQVHLSPARLPKFNERRTNRTTRPPSHYWTLTFQPQTECINQVVHLAFAGGFNTLTDLVVVLFPVPTVLKLQLPRRQRIIVVLLFAAGLLVCVAGAVRTYYTYIDTADPDTTWNTYYVWVTSCIELYVGIIGASIPATKPFFKRYLPRLLDSTFISTRSNTHYAISDTDKSPFSASASATNTNTSGSRSRPPSHMDVELGTITSPPQVAVRRMSRNLDAIEEVRGSDSSISTFLDGVGGGGGERMEEVDGGVGSLGSDGTIDMRSGGSNEDLIEEMDIAYDSSVMNVGT